MDTQNRIVVVGAGLAGLAAAVDAQARGFAVSVVEARDRVGGRVWSHRMPNGAIAELGAEWIMPDDGAVRAHCRELGLELADTRTDYRRREPRGSQPSTLRAQEAFAARAASALVATPSAARRELSVGSFLRSVAAPEGARAAFRARIEGTYAVDVDGVSLTSLDAERPFDLAPRSYVRVADGNQAIATRLAATLPDVRLSAMARSVTAHAGEVVVSGVDARGARWRMEAAAVIVAVPPGPAAELEFSPALPPAHADALREIPMGVAAKLAVQTAATPPLVSVQCSDLPFWCWTGAGADGRPRPVLTSFAGSPRAQAELRTEGGDPTTWRRRVAALVPEVELDAPTALKSWGDDPLSRGSYSAAGRRTDEHAASLRRPAGRIVFAGEHTGDEHARGTMDGALRSGTGAARRAADVATDDG